MREAYALASAWIDEQELSILDDPKQWRKRSRLSRLRREVDARMNTLDDDARRFFSRDFPAAYRFGANAAASSLGVSFAWDQIDVDAVSVLARDGFEDLLRSTQHVRETTKALIRRLARERSLLSLTVGTTAKQSGRDLARLLASHGVRGVTYANGARHRIGDYADMVIRTKTAVAYNTGSVNQAKQFGVQFMEVFDGTIDLPCASVANTIQTVEWCEANPVSHPRCQRSVSPRPDVTSATEARSTPPSSSAAQRADQHASEQARADAAKRRAALARKRARVST